jgi:hypothetical protein
MKFHRFPALRHLTYPPNRNKTHNREKRLVTNAPSLLEERSHHRLDVKPTRLCDPKGRPAGRSSHLSVRFVTSSRHVRVFYISSGKRIAQLRA